MNPHPGPDDRHDPLLLTCQELWESMERFDTLACSQLGIGRTDLRALNLLEHGPVPAGEIAVRLGLTSGSVTTLVDRLVRAGYVSRSPSPDDRRQVLVALEQPTSDAFARIYGPLGARVEATVRTFSAADRTVAARVIRAMARTFADHPAGPPASREA